MTKGSGQKLLNGISVALTPVLLVGAFLYTYRVDGKIGTVQRDIHAVSKNVAKLSTSYEDHLRNGHNTIHPSLREMSRIHTELARMHDKLDKIIEQLPAR